jgi:hypothetical protein
MKTFLLLLGLACGPLAARDIVPGIVSFDEPPGFRGMPPHHDPGDNPFELSRTVWMYLPDDNSSQSFRQLDIGIGVVGYAIGNGKVVTFRAVSDEQLKKTLIGPENDGRLALTFAPVVVSGRRAFRISWHRPAPTLRAGATLYSESYYVPFEANRGVTVHLTADSEERLRGLRELLGGVHIPKDAGQIPPPTTSAPEKPDPKSAALVGTWEKHDGQDLFRFTFALGGRVTCITATARVTGTFRLDTTRTPSVIAIAFDPDPRYEPGTGMRFIYEFKDARHLRLQSIDDSGAPPKRFTEDADILTRQ